MAALSTFDRVSSKNRREIAFIDLAAQQARIRPQLDLAIRKVLDHGQYIMGPEVEKLERGLADFTSARHVISCASGTDALLMVLMAKGVGPGDGVICPGFTYTATPEVIALLGATPIFADVDPKTFNLDPEGIEGAIDAARKSGLVAKAVIAVDLFGQPARYDAIAAIAAANGLFVLADAAQSFGASASASTAGSTRCRPPCSSRSSRSSPTSWRAGRRSRTGIPRACRMSWPVRSSMQMRGQLGLSIRWWSQRRAMRS